MHTPSLAEFHRQLFARKPLTLQPRTILPPPDTSYRPSHPNPARDLQSGIEPYTGAWTTAHVVHLLKRTMFGATRDHIAQLVDLTPAEAVAALLNNPEVNPPVNDYSGIVYDDGGVMMTLSDPVVPFGETWVNAPYTDDPNVVGARFISLKSWWVRQIRHSSLSIMEKLVIFWHNHFATQASEIFEPRFTYRHLSTLRQHALGNFREFVRAITLDPQMLVYLNGTFNVVGTPDENYARELQELFCIGKGPDSQYTEDDVQEAARVLTGWVVNNLDTLEVTFYPFLHDSQDKHFSAFYNNTTIDGQVGATGQNELDALIDMILDNPECAKFICRELYRFFVYHDIDENAELNVIAPLADVLRDNDYELLPTLQTLFASAHFFDQLNRAAVIKSPMDHLLGMTREFEVAFPPADQLHNNLYLGQIITLYLEFMQQSPGDPPNVAGWPAYYQTPQYDKNWITTDTFPRRVQSADLMLYIGVIYEGTLLMKIDPLAYTHTLSNPADPNALIDETLAQLSIYTLPAEGRAQLKNILLSGKHKTTTGRWHGNTTSITPTIAMHSCWSPTD